MSRGRNLLLVQRANAVMDLPPLGEPTDWLTGEEIACWRAIAATLPPGLLRNADEPILAGAARTLAYCRSVSSPNRAILRCAARNLDALLVSREQRRSLLENRP